MIRSLPKVLVLAAFARALPTNQTNGGPPGYESIDTFCPTLQCKQNAVNFAFIYGTPLYSYGQVADREPIAPPTNWLLHQRELQSAGDQEVVRPNADTLYSTTFIDLSENNLEITIPKITDRYVVWPFYDLYGNNFANIGNIASISHGKFLVCYDQDRIGVRTDCGIEGYDGCVGMPTPYGISMARIAVSNTTEDLKIARGYQDQMKVVNLPSRTKLDVPPLDLNLFRIPTYTPENGTTLQEAILRLTATLAPHNEPYVAEYRSWIAKPLQNAGMANGTWTPPAGVNLTATLVAANASAESLLISPESLEKFSNGWTAFDSDWMGLFGSLYNARFLITNWGYLGLTSDQAVYPLITGYKELSANRAPLLQFSSRPKIQETGFWSITLYGPDQYLVPNELNRHTLGDRSNLTFPVGRLVYDEGNITEDGIFELLLQPGDIQPLENWTNNWLPTTSGGGAMTFTLRWYGPEAAMAESGDYEYPTVSVIDAIRS